MSSRRSVFACILLALKALNLVLAQSKKSYGRRSDIRQIPQSSDPEGTHLAGRRSHFQSGWETVGEFC